MQRRNGFGSLPASSQPIAGGGLNYLQQLGSSMLPGVSGGLGGQQPPGFNNFAPNYLQQLSGQLFGGQQLNSQGSQFGGQQPWQTLTMNNALSFA